MQNELPYELFLSLVAGQPVDSIGNWCQTNQLYQGYCTSESFVWDLIRYSFDLLVEDATMDDYRLLRHLYQGESLYSFFPEYRDAYLQEAMEHLDTIEDISNLPNRYWLILLQNEELPDSITVARARTLGGALLRQPDILQRILNDPNLRNYQRRSLLELYDLVDRTQGTTEALSRVFPFDPDTVIEGLGDDPSPLQVADDLNQRPDFYAVSGSTLSNPQIVDAIPEITYTSGTLQLVAECLGREASRLAGAPRYYYFVDDQESLSEMFFLARSYPEALLMMDATADGKLLSSLIPAEIFEQWRTQRGLMNSQANPQVKKRYQDDLCDDIIDHFEGLDLFSFSNVTILQ